MKVIVAGQGSSERGVQLAEEQPGWNIVLDERKDNLNGRSPTGCFDCAQLRRKSLLICLDQDKKVCGRWAARA